MVHLSSIFLCLSDFTEQVRTPFTALQKQEFTKTFNRTSYNIPIYGGKAVPTGWRQARSSNLTESLSYELNSRIREHGWSLEQGAGLKPNDFRCRFIILEGAESDLIGTVEAALIRSYKPIWNSLIDGFGNHDPGSGRYEQAMSDWDVCHQGRSWAKKCNGKHNAKSKLLKRKRF